MLIWIVFSIFIMASAGAIQKEDCPDTIPHDDYTQILGNVCYRFELDIKKEYDDARVYCHNRGGSLALVKSKEINDFLVNELANRFNYHEVAWIGLNDKEKEEKFVWEDGTPLGYQNFVHASGFTHFFRHGLEDCVAIDVGDGGRWHDFKCSDYFLHIVNEHKRFICEFHVEVPETTTTTTTLAPTTTTTTTTTTNGTPKSTCPQLICDLDCGMTGFKSDENSCTICACDSGDDEIQPTTKILPTNPTSTATRPIITTQHSSSQSSNTTKTPCAVVECSLNCSGLGYATDANGCDVCECDKQ